MSSNLKLNENGQEEFSTTKAVLGNIIMLIWFILGTIACSFLNPIVAWVYLTYAIIMVYFVMRKLVCTNCYYYDKVCAMGWGKIASVFFKQGDISKFKDCNGQKLAPLVYGLISLIPIITLVISMILSFSLIKVVILAVFLLITFYTNVISRKSSCTKCKLRYECPGSMAK